MSETRRAHVRAVKTYMPAPGTGAPDNPYEVPITAELRDGIVRLLNGVSGNEELDLNDRDKCIDDEIVQRHLRTGWVAEEGTRGGLARLEMSPEQVKFMFEQLRLL